MTKDSRFFNRSHRTLQDRFSTRDLADRIEAEDVVDFIGPDEKEFIESSRMFFLTTVSHSGQPTVSYKGGQPGFVSVQNETSLLFPSYDGNGMYYSTGNLDQNSKVGLLVIDFATPNRLRIHGDATIIFDDTYVKRFPGAQFVVRVDIREAFDNCPRYIHRMSLIEESKYVPSHRGKAPRPAWKRLEYLQDALSEEDREKTDREGGPLSLNEYLQLLKQGEA